MVEVWTNGRDIGVRHSNGVSLFETIDEAIKFGDDMASIAIGIKESVCPKCGAVLGWSRPTHTRSYAPGEGMCAEEIPGPVIYESCSSCGYAGSKRVQTGKDDRLDVLERRLDKMDADKINDDKCIISMSRRVSRLDDRLDALDETSARRTRYAVKQSMCNAEGLTEITYKFNDLVELVQGIERRQILGEVK